MSHRRGTSAQARPNALSVSPRTTTRSVSREQFSCGEECQTSTHDQGEQPDGRVHRRTRCRKRQRAADAAPRSLGTYKRPPECLMSTAVGAKARRAVVP